MHIRFVTLLVALGLVAILAPATAAQTQTRGACAGKVPGAKDQGAIFQYCPKRAEAPPDLTPEPTSGGGGVVVDDGSGPGGPKESVGNQSIDVPFTGYPGNDGLNLIIWIMLAALALLGARALNRRFGDRLGGSATRWRQFTSRSSSEGSDQP